MKKPETLLLTDEVADLTRVSPHTVRAWRKQGLGPSGFRLNGRVVYREADVVAWIENRRREQAGVGAA